MTPAPPPPVHTISFAAVLRALSPPRIAAYSLVSDFDSVDAFARYEWNLALVAAITPVLHVVEIAFRNALFDEGVQTTSNRNFRKRVIDCWLDADPPFLERRESADVDEAVRRLQGNRARLTPGHLVSQLGFGFWVRLCNRPYEHGRAAGPQLWPSAVRRFPHCPRPKRNRADIGSAFADLRDFRNLVAHHQPVWDRDPVEWHRRAIELLSWMNPSLAAVTEQRSQLKAIYDAGPGPYRLGAAACVRS